jgi:hypothetical protein
MQRAWILLALVLIAAPPRVALAQSSTPVSDDRIAQLERQVADARSAADNSWMLVSSALVLMMTGPGLALFYGGLVRKKNVLATMMQSFAMMAVVTVLWGLVEYSLAFGSGSGFIGGLQHIFLRGVGAQPDPDYAATIPQQTFMVYQLMFAVITPALITGAFAERMKFSAMALFMILWSLIVYAPMAHMVWGKGGLLNAALGGRFPTLDFAGGTVVHITSGTDAPAQCGPELYRCLPALGWLVWIQRRQRVKRGKPGHQRVRGHPFCGGDRRHWLGRRGVDSQRQAQRVGRNLWRGSRIGGHHPGCRLCRPDGCPAHRTDCRSLLLCHGS